MSGVRFGIPYLNPERYADLLGEAGVAAVELDWRCFVGTPNYSVSLLRTDGYDGCGHHNVTGRVTGNGDGWHWSTIRPDGSVAASGSAASAEAAMRAALPFNYGLVIW